MTSYLSVVPQTDRLCRRDLLKWWQSRTRFARYLTGRSGTPESAKLHLYGNAGMNTHGDHRQITTRRRFLTPITASSIIAVSALVVPEVVPCQWRNGGPITLASDKFGCVEVAVGWCGVDVGFGEDYVVGWLAVW